MLFCTPASVRSDTTPDPECCGFDTSALLPDETRLKPRLSVGPREPDGEAVAFVVEAGSFGKSFETGLGQYLGDDGHAAGLPKRLTAILKLVGGNVGGRHSDFVEDSNAGERSDVEIALAQPRLVPGDGEKRSKSGDETRLVVAGGVENGSGDHAFGGRGGSRVRRCHS